MRFTVRMPDEYEEKINTLAKRLGLRKSDIVRLAVRRFADENLPADEKTSFQKIRDLLGTAESGISDLGRRHRDYLVKKVRERSR
jgi:Arc/MetJ-type ribon-helix-helix transcriptional regulator